MIVNWSQIAWIRSLRIELINSIKSMNWIVLFKICSIRLRKLNYWAPWLFTSRIILLKLLFISKKPSFISCLTSFISSFIFSLNQWIFCHGRQSFYRRLGASFRKDRADEKGLRWSESWSKSRINKSKLYRLSILIMIGQETKLRTRYKDNRAFKDINQGPILFVCKIRIILGISLIFILAHKSSGLISVFYVRIPATYYITCADRYKCVCGCKIQAPSLLVRNPAFDGIPTALTYASTTMITVKFILCMTMSVFSVFSDLSLGRHRRPYKSWIILPLLSLAIPRPTWKHPLPTSKFSGDSGFSNLSPSQSHGKLPPWNGLSDGLIIRLAILPVRTYFLTVEF